ncbi:ABC-F family ATP-binding cassette domain-containing protein [Mitsuokella sp. AF21-1AC]|uniref:ABC-F family ATP-binding cassette domain-containing protein n=1 Tax=Mitsuokella sp. AF21-1AC TaxID=2292235 RepID=UPI000E498349|nr:ABC-F family ATP-binding cassette domain-containing protein [Mitsuokella sp. AF21-1AC]RGS70421.1 ABC transporter ATP-binding protein [Mitsuokella sp. AF21-1AC]
MGMLKVTGLKKAFGIDELFHDVSFEVSRGDKVGFVGANGAGKTTLMRCLLGLEETDGGTIQLDDAGTIGYVEQQADFGDGTLYEEFLRAFDDVIALGERKKALEKQIADHADEETMAAYGKVVERFELLGGYDFESRIRRVAFGLGFTEEDFDKDVAHFSGGQKTRICLTKALLREPDFLFLDEPTNHLDIHMIEWLEGFLKNYSGGVLIISHDRYFLDRVATRILELAGRTVTNYDGNYTYYMKVKTERRAALQSAYEKQQEHIRKTEEYIRKYKAGIKSKQARGRQSQLNRLERIVLPPEDASFNYFALNKPPECAQRVAELEDVSMSFGSHTIFEHLSLLIRRGDGVALVGPNGAGKTTLLRILVGELESPTGRVKIGSRVKIGYFSQQHEGLHMDRTILDELIYEYGINEEQARKYLGAFLFHGDEVLRLIGDLSGGEQSRVAFLKLMLTGANFLILDEPTNHLDIPAREAVEEALMAFPGTFLAVSHDRYFLDKVANCTLELADGKLTEYLGNYSYYLMKKELAEEEGEEERLAAEKLRKAKEEKEKHKQKPAAAEKRAAELAAEQRAREEEKKRAEIGRIQSMSDAKREEMIQRAEAEIAMAEAELKGLEFQMNDPEIQSDPQKSQEIAAAYAAKEEEIEQRYAKWERLTEA